MLDLFATSDGGNAAQNKACDYADLRAEHDSIALHAMVIILCSLGCCLAFVQMRRVIACNLFILN